MTEKLTDGPSGREAQDCETPAALQAALAGFLDARRADFAAGRLEAAAAKRDLLAVMLQVAGRAMHVAEMRDMVGWLNECAGGGIVLTNPKYHLLVLKDQGRIKSLEKGVYAHSETDCGTYERSGTISENILAVLDAAAGPLTAREIMDYCLGKAHRRIATESVRAELRALVRQAKVKHLHTNAYAAAGFDDSGYERPLAKYQAVVKILTANGRPMPVSAIEAALKAAGQTYVNTDNVRNMLSKSCAEGLIRHLDRGVYACLAFNPELYRRPENNKSRVLAVLNSELKPMTIDDVVVGLSRVFGRREKKDTVQRRLKFFSDKGIIKRLGRGLYASPDYTEPAAPPPAPPEPVREQEKPPRQQPPKQTRKQEKPPPEAKEPPPSAGSAKKAKPKRAKKKKPAEQSDGRRPTAAAGVRERIRLLADLGEGELSVDKVVADLENSGQPVSDTLRSFIATLLERHNASA